MLGTAAGGAYPQWNCACATCTVARRRSTTRSHASLAVSGTGSKWYLVNATPDVLSQIGRHKELEPGPQIRQTPLKGILLTDAELDHTVGLLLLREGTQLTVYAPASVLQALGTSFPVRTMLENYAGHNWAEVTCGHVFDIDDGSLAVTAFATGNKKPRYADASCSGSVWTVGYRFEDRRSGGVAVYAPAIEAWNGALESALHGADCIFADGTFWTEEELIAAGVGRSKSAQTGHLPVGGSGGIADRLSAHSRARKFLVHINNTNPILDDQSPQYRALQQMSITVPQDGLHLEI